VNPPDNALRYRAYLLRLWSTDAGDTLVWRALLEDPHTGERHGFANLNALLAFLHDQTGETPTSPDNTHSVE
jgi:hypothetical protein